MKVGEIGVGAADEDEVAMLLVVELLDVESVPVAPKVDVGDVGTAYTAVTVVVVALPTAVVVIVSISLTWASSVTCYCRVSIACSSKAD